MIRNLLSLTVVIGVLHAAGTVVVIQPSLTEQDYRTVEHFTAALDRYFTAADTGTVPGEARLFVLPEYVGAWLVAVDAPESVFRAPDVNAAMTRLILRHPLRFLAELLYSLIGSDFHGPLMGHVQRSIFIMRAEPMRAAYQQAFRTLARRHRCWIVAGSVLLPEAEIADGQIGFVGDRTGEHYNLMNQSFVFDPEGQAVLVAKKVYPVQEELDFLDPGPVEELKVVATDLGRLGVLVCADSWYPDCYQALDQKEVDIIAVPSFVNPAERWESPWHGYNPPDSAPEDIAPADTTGQYREKEMWEKYSLCGRMGPTGAALGVNSFLIGSFWGMTGSGQSNIIEQGEIKAKAPDFRGEDILYYRRD
jgi:predicted amidohydrolase